MDRDNSHGKRRQTSEESAPEEDRKARNRLAAQKCRKNKDEQMQKLKKKNQELEETNKKLAEEKKELKQQALAYKQSVAMHFEKGCKIPKEMIQLWDKEIEDNSSDEDDSDRNMQGDVDVSEDMSAPPQCPSDMPGTSQDLQNELPGNAEQLFQAPVALFSGTPLTHLHGARSRNNSCSKSSSPPYVTPAQLFAGDANPPVLTDLSSFLETTRVPSSLAHISTRSTNDVKMQVNITGVPYRASNNQTSMISNTYCGMGNLPQMVLASRDITQVQNVPPVVQPRTAFGTRHQLPNNTSMGISDQITMDYQPEGRAEERILSSEAVTNQNSASNFFRAPEGYTFSEELFQPFTSKNGNKGSENDEIQVEDVASNTGVSYLRSQSQREPTIPVHTIAPALLNIGHEMSHSLQQQIKTFSSLPCPTVQTLAGTDASNKFRQNSWPPNATLNSRPEEQTESPTHQPKCNTHNVHPMIASRHVGSWSETASRDRHVATGQTFNMPKVNAIKEPIQATVLSPEQLFTLKQRYGERQNPQSGSFTGRKASVMSHQQHGQLEQQATWSPSTDRPNSKAGNTSGQTVTHALFDSKSQPVVDLAAQKIATGTNTLGSYRATNYNQTLNLNQPGLKTSSSFLQRVPQTTISRTNQISPNTATSHTSASISPPTSCNTSSDQIMHQSLFQQTNGNFTHGHGRLAVATTNNGDVSAPSQYLAAINSENGFILATSNKGVPINKPPGLNTTSWQFHPQITRSNNTVHEFTPNITTSNSGVPSSTATRLNTTLQPQITSENNAAKGFIPYPATSNNSVPSSTATRLNTASQPDIHGANPTNGHTLPAAATNAIYSSTPSPYKSTQPDVPCFNISISGAPTSTVGSQSSINSRSPFVATVLSQKQVSTAITTRTRNGYSPNTEASSNGTDTADQIFSNTSSETSLQPMIQFSGGNFPTSQGQLVTPEDHLPMKDTPHDMFDDSTSQWENIDYLSESPQTIETVQLRNTADDTPEYISNNAGVEIMADVTINTQFNNDSTFESYVLAVLDAINNGGDTSSLTTNTNLGDNVQGLSNLNNTSQPSPGQILNPNLPNFSDIINHNGL